MANEKQTSAWRGNRFVIIALGAVIGALWGMVMWGVMSVLGQDSGVRGLIYLAVTMAMIGCGVAAVFGAVAVKRHGERVSPRVRRDR
ncbi:MAG: hypothetical protein KDC33_12655 [Thermoleophilia bacterium]|nr:hypothetical protein [Thermoleophilia bacterium]